MTDLEEKIYQVIRVNEGLKGRQIAVRLGVDKYEVNSLLSRSIELKDLVMQKEDYGWYLIKPAKDLKKPAEKKPSVSATSSTSPAMAKNVPEKPKQANNRAGRKPANKDLKVGDPCPECGKPIVEKDGRYGIFLACSGFPECKFTKTIEEKVNGRCPKCGDVLVKRFSKKGYAYFRCVKGSDCGFITWHLPMEENCPKCGKTLFRPKGSAVLFCLNERCSEYKPEEYNAAKGEEAPPTKAEIVPPKKVEKPQQAAKPVKKKWNNI